MNRWQHNAKQSHGTVKKHNIEMKEVEENCQFGKGFIYMEKQKHWVKKKKKKLRDFPGGAVVKNPPANAGDTGSSPGLGRSHMPRSN